MNLVDRGGINRSIYIGAVAGTFLYASLYYISPLFNSMSPLKEILMKFPLVKYEMGWVLPTIGGILFCKMIEKLRQYLLGSNTANIVR